MKEHLYQISLQWAGNKGQGTKDYQDYDRAYKIEVEGKPVIFGSSDPVFRGDRRKYNPEEIQYSKFEVVH